MLLGKNSKISCRLLSDKIKNLFSIKNPFTLCVRFSYKKEYIITKKLSNKKMQKFPQKMEKSVRKGGFYEFFSGYIADSSSVNFCSKHRHRACNKFKLSAAAIIGAVGFKLWLWLWLWLHKSLQFLRRKILLIGLPARVFFDRISPY